VDGASSDIKGKAGTLPNLFYVSAEDKLKNRCDWLDATSSDIKAEDDGMHRPDWEKLTYTERYIKLDTGRPRLDGHIPGLQSVFCLTTATRPRSLLQQTLILPVV
jgi:hypothetical protein